MSETLIIKPSKVFVKVMKVTTGQTEAEFIEQTKNQLKDYEFIDGSKGSYLFKRKKVVLTGE
jgi:hypothetical protein